MLSKFFTYLTLIILSPVLIIVNIYRLIFSDKINKNNQSKKRFVQFTTNGFNVLDYQFKTLQQIRWKQVVNVKWESALDDKIHFNLTHGKSLILNKRSTGYWFGIIRNIPEGYISYDYDASNKLFNTLETCEFCGYIALGSYSCYNCQHVPFHKYNNSNNISKEEYIEQCVSKLSLSVLDPLSKTADSASQKPFLDCGFEMDPSITQPPFNLVKEKKITQ